MSAEPANPKSLTGSPSVTVVVAVFNGERTLQRCIDSVAGQTYASKELIVMDGGSPDGTVDILKNNNDKIAYWESKPDRGIGHAWNKALEHSSGEWIIFLGADDYFWREDVLERTAPHLANVYPSARVVYGTVGIVTARGDVLEMVGQPWDATKRSFSWMMNISHQGLFHHRSLFEACGRFDESFRIAGDYELLLRELRSTEPVFVPGVVVSAMQRGGLSTDPYLTIKTVEEFRRARIKNGLPGVSAKWTWLYIKSWVKRGMHLMLGERRSHAYIDIYRILSGRNARGKRYE